MTLLDHTHPIVGRTVLLPGGLFHAEVGGKVSRRPYRYLRMRDTGSVDAVDWRGNARTIAVERITRVRRMPRDAT